MLVEVVCDFETASHANLKRVGAWRYAEDPTTEVLCLIYECVGAVLDWRPGRRDDRLTDMAKDDRFLFISHGGFEQAIWQRIMVERYGFPPLPPERWHDIQAVAGWKGLPMAHEKLAAMLGVDAQKDMEGSKLTIGLSKPNRKTAMLDRSPESLARVVEYCKTDVAGEAQNHRKLGYLSEEERHVWLIDQRINQRGVRLDLDFISSAQRVVDRASVPLLSEFRELTSGLNPGQGAKIIEWCAGQGVELPNMQKVTLAALLGEEEEPDDETEVPDHREEALQRLPERVGRVLEIRSMLASASVKKLAAMRACVGYDGRARGLVQYAAAHTLRWGGRILQPQNFPRGDWGRLDIDPETVVRAIASGDPVVVERELRIPAIRAVGDALRYAMVAGPGATFVSGDYSGIELRVDLALAGQHDKCADLAAGHDVYLDMACDIYNKPRGFFNKVEHVPERTIGKNTVLGCGFQMGPATFHDRYCPDQPIEFAEQVVEAYRKKWAPKVPQLWYALEEAALNCVKYRTPTSTHGINFAPAGEWMVVTRDGCWQQLWYYRPRFEPEGSRFGEDCWSYLGKKLGRTTRIQMYGGIICENVVQWLARGILAQAMSRLERQGFPLVLTVHDEAVAEVPIGDPDKLRAQVASIMEEQPPWVQEMGIPIQVETWCYPRYRK